MSRRISVRLTLELADWLEGKAARLGVARSKIVVAELERARTREAKPFQDLIGCISGPPDLSSRKGFSGRPWR